MIEVDGSYGEGGGQVLRMALALSSLTGREVRVFNIRAGRPNPGLARQHITAAKAVASLSQAEVEGLKPGSPEVVFRPGSLKGGTFNFDVGTAGSVTLVLQACLLPAILADGPTRLRVRGGTDVKWAPPSDYFLHVFLPILSRMGCTVDMRVLKRGYYPRGGGLVEVDVDPSQSLQPLSLREQGRLEGIRGIVHVSNLPDHIAQRMKRAALKALMRFEDVRIESPLYGPDRAVGPGGSAVLWAETESTLLGSSRLAERGIRAEDVGRGAAEDLVAEISSGATLDVHAADQLLPYMSLAQGVSTFLVREVSGHLQTLLWLLPKFLDVDFRMEEVDRRTRLDVHPIHT